MFQFRRLPPYRYTLRTLRYSDWAYPAGFPHSEIHGSTSAFDSPWLIADCCVLRRLLVPRHSPCALCSLTIFESLVLLVKETLDDNLNCSCYPKINFTFLLLHMFYYIVQFSRCIIGTCVPLIICLAADAHHLHYFNITSDGLESHSPIGLCGSRYQF